MNQFAFGFAEKTGTMSRLLSRLNKETGKKDAETRVPGRGSCLFS
jgi:hypothetical protein